MIFCHLGVGAADLDVGANNRCGVTEFIKLKLQNKNSQNYEVYLVEANPINISKIKTSYKNYSNVKIFNIGVTSEDKKKIRFYYAEDDAPHYQTCSMSVDSVKFHHPSSKISSFEIDAVNTSKFFEQNNIKKIDYLFIDLEGIDFEVLSSINFKKIDIRNISIEYINLESKKKKMINFLINRGFSYCGYGYDHSKFDFLFKKKIILWNIILSKFLHILDHKYIEYFNYFIFSKEIKSSINLKIILKKIFKRLFN